MYPFIPAAGGTPFGGVADDQVYGRSSRLRQACEQAGTGYVFAVSASLRAWLPSGRYVPAGMLARLIPACYWEIRRRIHRELDGTTD